MTIIKKFKPQDLEKKTPKRHLLWVALYLFVLILTQIWVNNTAVSYGEKLESISKLKYALEMENQILENEIADGSSLGSIASNSAKLGFSKIDSIQYIR